MFLAILSDSYSKVKETHQSGDGKHLGLYLLHRLRSVFDRKKKKVTWREFRLDLEKKLDDDFLEADELQVRHFARGAFNASAGTRYNVQRTHRVHERSGHFEGVRH